MDAPYPVGGLVAAIRRRSRPTRAMLDKSSLYRDCFALALLALAIFLSLALAAVAPGPVIGSGGYLGALGKAIVLTHFATIGGLILAGSFMLGGLLLSTDYALIETIVFLYRVASLPARGRDNRQNIAKALAAKRNRTDLDESIADVAVKIRGKSTQPAAVANEGDAVKDAAVNDKPSPVTLRVVNPSAEKTDPLDGATEAEQNTDESALKIKNPS